LNCVKKLEKDKKDTAEGHGEEGEDEDREEGQGSQEPPPSFVENLDAIKIGRSPKRKEKPARAPRRLTKFGLECRARVLIYIFIYGFVNIFQIRRRRPRRTKEHQEHHVHHFKAPKPLGRLPHQRPGSKPTMLFHGDLSRHNILVDGKGVLTGVVDWDFVSFLPYWIACQLPPVLHCKPLDEEPIKSIPT
jgi:hypothetical protein